MILINLLGTKHADVNLEWEANEILRTQAKYGREFVFHVDRDEVLPFIVEGSTEGGDLGFSFDEEGAVLCLLAGSHELEISARLDAPAVVQVHFRGRVYDSREAFAASADLLKPGNLFGVISLALARQESESEGEPGVSREELLLFTRLGKKKMKEALALFKEVMVHVLAPAKRESENLKNAIRELDFPFSIPRKASKKPAKKLAKKSAKKSAKKAAKKKALK